MTDQTPEDLLAQIADRLDRLMTGGRLTLLDIGEGSEPRVKELAATVNRLLAMFNEAQDFILALAGGKLETPPPPRNLLASPFKQLQANLLHLTWQTRQVAAGDYGQRVYFMGEFADSFNAMVEALADKERTEKLLRETEAKVRHLEGIIPICMYCKKIRDDRESWQQLETYITEHSEATFSHGICPECLEKLRAEFE